MEGKGTFLALLHRELGGGAMERGGPSAGGGCNGAEPRPRAQPFQLREQRWPRRGRLGKGRNARAVPQTNLPGSMKGGGGGEGWPQTPLNPIA